VKFVFWLASLGVLGFAVAFGSASSDHHVLIVTGSIEGYLAPCGCAKPMSGGLKRRVTAIRQWSVKGRTTVIDNGGSVSGVGRQDQMKAETFAETMKLVGIDAINCGLEEARLGSGMVAAIDRLSGGALVNTGYSAVADFKASGPFLIGAVDPRTSQLSAALGEQVLSVDSAVTALLSEAQEADLVPVLMTRGNAEHAEQIAKRHTGLRLIVCATESTPLEEPKKVGETLIVTPGEHGKFVLRIEWDGSQFSGYQFANLGPEFVDDEAASRLYQAYLARVGREDLISMIPRADTELFAGTATCASCHGKEHEVWNESKHARALSTLEASGHDRDPDCVSCHVVGLRSVNGFVDRKQTPLLSDVGCESCHGPSRQHALAPEKTKTKDKAVDACVTCHVPQHSPGFDFEEYWKKIAH